jgi:hypothetical protein
MSRLSWARALILAVPVSLGLGGCFGYVPGEIGYWDARVDELCQKDGGVTIFEAIELPTAEYERYLRRGELWLPSVFGPNGMRPDPIYARRTLTSLRIGNPHVTKSTVSIVRGSDQKVLATRVTYTRDVNLPSFGPSRHDQHQCPGIADATFFAQAIKERRTQ